MSQPHHVICQIYRSPKEEGMYLYVQSKVIIHSKSQIVGCTRIKVMIPLDHIILISGDENLSTCEPLVWPRILDHAIK